MADQLIFTTNAIFRYVKCRELVVLLLNCLRSTVKIQMTTQKFLFLLLDIFMLCSQPKDESDLLSTREANKGGWEDHLHRGGSDGNKMEIKIIEINLHWADHKKECRVLNWPYCWFIFYCFSFSPSYSLILQGLRHQK